jgi:hypothetical protein
MNTFKKRMLAAAIIAGLAVIGSLMNSQQSTVRAAGGPTVTIDQAQLPLPVQGNVGINGTPNVKVTNPATAPALTLDISKSASRHVHLVCVTFAIVCTSSDASVLHPPPYIVPAGENLMVTSVDLFTIASSPSKPLFFSVLQGGLGLIAGAWVVPNDGFTHSFQYPSGIVFPAGYTFDNTHVFMDTGADHMSIEGFLTPI